MEAELTTELFIN